MSNAFGIGAAAERGRAAAFEAGVTRNTLSGATQSPSSSADSMPAWASKMQSQQSSRHNRQLAVHAIRDGDRGGSGANPDIDEKD
jgi:type IV secretion system protein TrbL